MDLCIYVYAYINMYRIYIYIVRGSGCTVKGSDVGSVDENLRFGVMRTRLRVRWKRAVTQTLFMNT